MVRVMRRGDLLAAAAVLAAVGAAFALRTALTGRGNTVTIVTPAETQVLSLSTDAVLTLTGREGYTVTVEVRGGAAQVVAADCPDQVCVLTGTLSRAGETAACVPAGIVLTVNGEAEVDAVAG